jgi:AbrB family looped-hinge helix DNA binding protein
MRKSKAVLQARVRPVGHSRITSKGQATIPLQVRKRLKLEPGDAVLFEESDSGAISLRRGDALDLACYRALENTLPDWGSKNDDDAYRDL